MDKNLLAKVQCTDNEKTELLKTVFLMVNLGHESNCCGLLHLDEILEKTDNRFLKIAIKLIVKGYDVECIRTVLENIIHSESCDNKTLFEKILISKAVIEIYYRSSSEVIKTTLLSMLGEKWLLTYFDKDSFSYLYNSSLPEERQIIQDMLFNHNDLQAEENRLYYAVMETLKKLLKSFHFFNQLAALYWLGVKKDENNEKINKIAMNVLAFMDEYLTPILIETGDNFYLNNNHRRNTLNKLLNFMDKYEYIKFGERAVFTLKRFLEAQKDKDKVNQASDLYYDFPICVNEFLKLMVLAIGNSHHVYDLNLIIWALKQTVFRGEKAEDLREKVKEELQHIR